MVQFEQVDLSRQQGWKRVDRSNLRNGEGEQLHPQPTPCWSWAFGSKRKEKVVDTSSWSKVPLESLRDGWRSHTKERSELVHLIRMSPGLLYLEVFWSCPTGPKVDPGLPGGIKYPVRPGDTLGSTMRSWKVLLVRRTSGTFWWACCHGSTISDIRKKMDGWRVTGRVEHLCNS